MGEEVTEKGLQHGASGTKRRLGIRSRAERRQSQENVVEAGGSVRVSRSTGDPILEEKRENRVQKEQYRLV